MSDRPARARTTRADGRHGHRRRASRPAAGLAIAAVVAFVLALAAPSVAVASHPETQITVACAQKSNELLRVVTSTSDCRPRQETPVVIWPGPTQLCIQPDGSVRRFTSTKACTGVKPPGTVVTVPTSTPMYFCAPASGVLRQVASPSQCTSRETAYVIGNHAPLDILLSNASVAENEPAGTTVGTFSITDGDPASTATYSLVSGTGSDDNAAFAITGATLQTAAAFDYETQASYSIRVRAADGYGGSREEVFEVQVSDVVEDVAPTAVDDTATIEEDAATTTIGVLANDTDPDGGPIAIDSVTQPADGTVAIAADAASVTYLPDADACNDGDSADDFTYALAPGGSTATVSVTVTCVDDLPASVADEVTVAEDSGATPIEVLANDTDVDGGPLAIATASDPAHGTVVLSGGLPGASTGLTYEPDPQYCNDPPGTTTDAFSYTLTPGGSTANVDVTVVCVDDGPVAGDDLFAGQDGAVGNTALVIDDPTDGPPAVDGPHLVVAGDLLANDADPDGGGALELVPGTVDTEDGGTATIQADGDVVFRPAAGTSCEDGTDAFEYTVVGAGGDEDAPTDTGRVAIGLSGCVWYVSNDAGGDSGTSTAPFDTVAQAVAATPGGDAIFVFAGDGTTTGYDTGVALDGGQDLIGEAAPLVVGGRALHDGTGDRPTLTHPEFDVVAASAGGNSVAGLQLDPTGTFASGVSFAGGSGAVDVHDVHVIDTGDPGLGPGIEVAAWTGQVTMHDLTIDVNGTGIAVADSPDVLVDGPGVVAVRAVGAPALTGWNSGLDGSTFDSLIAEDSPNGGIRLEQTTGSVTIGALDLTTTGTTPAFLSDFAGPVTITPTGQADIDADGGPAVYVIGSTGSSLSFDEVSSVSGTHGIFLSGTGAGTFSAGSGQLTAGGTAVLVATGTGDVTYGGTIADGSGALSFDVTERTGGTVTLSGPIADGDDAGGGIRITGNTGGATVLSGSAKAFSTGAADAVRFDLSDGHALSIPGGGLDIDTTGGRGLLASVAGSIAVTGAGNTIDTGTGTALEVALTDIAEAGVTVERVSSDGAPSGIVLTYTGTAGGLSVTGLGSTDQGGDDSGGTIRNTTGDGIALFSTVDPSFRNMRLVDTGGNGVNGSLVDGFAFTFGSITGAGDAAGEHSVSFDDSTVDANLTGAVAITDSVITGTEATGISVTNVAGTITHADVSRNRISDGGTTTTPGFAIGFAAAGDDDSVASITRATIHGNVITDFRAGGGIVVRGGNLSGSGPAGSVGTPGTTNVISVSGNSMDGGNGEPGSRPRSFFSGGVQGAGMGNFDVSGNGTTANPLRNFDMNVIDLVGFRRPTLESKVSGNVIEARNLPGFRGISVTATSDAGLAGSGAQKTLIQNNTVTATAGSGILASIGNSDGTLDARVLGNTVAAPTTTTGTPVAGIRVESGSTLGSPTLCLEIAGNTTAGSSNPAIGATSPGISLRRENAPNAGFGIEGLVPSPAGSPIVENHVNSLNASAAGTVGVGGTVLAAATTGFTACTAP